MSTSISIDHCGGGVLAGPRRTTLRLILALMVSAHSYIAEVNRILSAAVSLFPAENSTVELRRDPAPAGGELPEGDSGLASAAEEAAGRYRSDDARATALSEALHGAVNDAATHARQANESARSISQAAATSARAVLAEGPEPHNLVLLVKQMNGRLAAMQEHVDQTRQELQAAAQKIQAHGAEMTATRRA